MILTVLVLSSTVLSLSAIGGYLMLIRLRTSADVTSTTKAIYIADAGLECAAYKHFKGVAVTCDGSPYNEFSYNDGTPVSGATYGTEDVAGPPSYIRATGAFRNVNRSFRLDY